MKKRCQYEVSWRFLIMTEGAWTSRLGSLSGHKPIWGGVIWGLFPVFHKKYLPFPAFRGFFFLIFRFPQLFIVFLGFSGFPQLPKGLFRFPQILKYIFRFLPYYPFFSGFPWLKNGIFRSWLFGILKLALSFMNNDQAKKQIDLESYKPHFPKRIQSLWLA